MKYDYVYKVAGYDRTGYYIGSITDMGWTSLAEALSALEQRYNAVDRVYHIIVTDCQSSHRYRVGHHRTSAANNGTFKKLY